MYIFFKTRGVSIGMLCDSGSPYTIIPKALYETLFSKCDLHDTDIAASGDTPIQIHGYFIGKLEYKSRTATDKVYVSQKGTTIIGWPTQGRLKIILDSSKAQPVLQTTTQVNIADEFPEVFVQDSVKVAKHFKHKIRWKEDATLIQHKIRNVPLSVKSAVATR